MWIQLVIFLVLLAGFTAAMYQFIQYILKKKREDEELEKIDDAELIKKAEEIAHEYAEDNDEQNGNSTKND